MHKNEGKRLSSDANVVEAFCIVCAAFILCWLPIVYMITASSVLNRVDVILKALRTVSFYIVATGSLANPLIYAFLKPDFKMTIRNFFSRTSRSETYESGPTDFPTVARWSKENFKTVTGTEPDTKNNLSVVIAK